MYTAVDAIYTPCDYGYGSTEKRNSDFLFKVQAVIFEMFRYFVYELQIRTNTLRCLLKAQLGSLLQDCSIERFLGHSKSTAVNP